MVKVIFRHGEKRNKTPEMPPVAKEDVMNLPLYLREYAPVKEGSAYRWVIPRPDGKNLVIVTGEGGIKDGTRLVTMFVSEPTEPASQKRPGVPQPTGLAR